jgi:hypothetical protein
MLFTRNSQGQLLESQRRPARWRLPPGLVHSPETAAPISSLLVDSTGEARSWVYSFFTLETALLNRQHKLKNSD